MDTKESKVDRDFPREDKGVEAGSKDEYATLSRNHPIQEFLRIQKGLVDMKALSEEEFLQRYETFCREHGYEAEKSVDSVTRAIQDMRADVSSGKSEGVSLNLKRIVLKFTTMSESGTDAPSFTVSRSGASIGRDSRNEVSVPSDVKLEPTEHARIEFTDGFFYLIDRGFTFGAGVRIGIGPKSWELVEGSRFSAGASIFSVQGINESRNLKIEIIEGPIKNSCVMIPTTGGCIGRSGENSISIPDKELSRRHSQIIFDDKSGKYYIQDVGSTNGTYMLLYGPNSGPYKLNLNDHILVGRTGFSVNRFDYGISEEIGFRQTMEDSCVIVQDLSVLPLCAYTSQYTPQSFFGVFDGHGGPNTSKYLSKHLHVNVADGLAAVTPDILQILESSERGSKDEDSVEERIDNVVQDMLKTVYLQTDKNFIADSEFRENGSTATTVLILGQRLYCANVGDSRTLLCRNFKPYALSEDHKPSREDEAKRIRESGGFVINNRVMGELAVSRAFGDCEFKKGLQCIAEEEGLQIASEDRATNWDDPLIIAEPEIKITTISEEDQFLVLACDGLFDVFTGEEVVSFVKNFLEKNGCDVQKCAQSLTFEAIRKRNSRDNVSVILILLNKWF